jgi:hypothetical protein
MASVFLDLLFLPSHVLACVCSSLILETRDKQQKGRIEQKVYCSLSQKYIFSPSTKKERMREGEKENRKLNGKR